MNKEIIGKRISKFTKWLLIILWGIVAILLVVLIKRNSTLSVLNIERDASNIFKTDNVTVLHLDDYMLVSVITVQENKKIIELSRDLYKKISKYQFNNKIEYVELLLGDINDKPIIFSKVDIKYLKKIKWEHVNKYDDAIRELNIEFWSSR